MTALASVLLIGVSLVVLAGWTFERPFLTGLGGTITMKANAAIGLLLSAVALACTRRRESWARAGGRLCATVAGLIGAVTLGEHLLGWNLGIDDLIFDEEPGAAATASPGRMGPNASTSLTLGAIALLKLYRRDDERAVVWAQLLASCMAVLALVPLVGYLYGAEQLYAFPRVTGIAWHTGLAVLTLSIGILTARPDAGPISALMTDAPHAVMARRLLAAAIVLPLVLGYLRVTGERLELYDSGFGAAAFVVLTIVLFTAMIWRTAVALQRSEHARRSAEAALTETEGRFRHLADQAPVLVWVEEAGERVWFNRTWYEFTGQSAPGVEWRLAIHPEDLPAYDEALRTAARAGDGYSHQYRLRRAGGEYAWVLETASPRAAGFAHGYVGSCIDVTALHEAQQQEREARERAERADRAKDDFIAALSHELRTPLNAIVGWMQMLQDGTLSEASRTRAEEAVTRNARVLARLVEDLIDTSRVAMGHLELAEGVVDMRAVVLASVESVMPTARAKDIAVEVTCASHLPPLTGDTQRLQQVVWNLLTNAIKFSAAGGRVEVHAAEEDGAVTVRVRDFGDGIDPDLLPFVFDRFRQGASPSTWSPGGLGLGLFIARHLVERHDGTIDARSEGRGHGAIFLVRLTVQRQSGIDRDAARAGAQMPALT